MRGLRSLVGSVNAPRASRWLLATATVLVGALILLRDDALTQFATDAPTHALTIELAPMLGAFGIAVTPELTAALGTAASAALVLPLADAQTVDTLRARYRIAAIVDRWGLVAAAVLALAGIILSRRPLRTLAIALGLTGAASLVALPLFDRLTGWLLGGGAGAWSPLIAPLVESAVAQVRPWLVPIGIGALIAGAAVGAAWFLRERRRATASGIASVPTDDQPERATRPSTPWTNEPESSVENSLASSTASSIATPEGTSSL